MGNRVSTIRKCKNIRDQIYDREQLPGTIFKREVLELISPESTIADIGCGREASFLRSLSSCVKKAYGVDLEISETIIDGNMQIMYGDAEAIPLRDHSVDVIILVNLVEHLRNPKRVFLECKRILKPGGSLVLTTPCKFHPPILFGRAIPHRIRQWANLIITGTKKEDTFPAYYKANSAGDLCRLGSSAGLSVVSSRYLSNHPQYFMFSTFFYRCAVSVERHVLQQEAFRWFRQQIFCHFINPSTTTL